MKRIIAMILFVGFILVLVYAVAVNKKELNYKLVEYVPARYDTFWSVYENTYPEKVSYQQALSFFKKDNGLQQYELYEGKTYYIRVYEEE